MRTRIRLRRALERDIERILKIETDAFRRDAWPRSVLLATLRNCPELFLVAKLSGKIAGYSVTQVDDARAELISIAVFAAARGRGAGEALLRSTLRSLKQRGVKTWTLTVRVGNDDAIRLYRRVGFVRVRRVNGYYGRGGDAWRMRLTIA